MCFFIRTQTTQWSRTIYTCVCPSLNAYLSLHMLLDGSGVVIGNSGSDWLLSVLGRTTASYTITGHHKHYKHHSYWYNWISAAAISGISQFQTNHRNEVRQVYNAECCFGQCASSHRTLLQIFTFSTFHETVSRFWWVLFLLCYLLV